ncbi:MAG: DUF4445 domain-containing protein [Pirellulales bacterium]|nr:DUF4445 domain-containing protein [Pirellulales bacterium]
MSSYRVRFQPEGALATVEEGQRLLDAARSANVYVGAICGGDGTCGKCRLVVREGDVTGESTDFLTADEIRHGYVLACQVTPQSDVVVEVPPESRLSGYVGISEDSDRFSDFSGRVAEPVPEEPDPLIRKLYVTLREPTLEDPLADQERLLAAIERERAGPWQMGLKVVRELPRVVRRFEAKRTSWNWRWDGRVTATVGLRKDVGEILAVEAGDTSGRNFGLALDVGTTTVVAHLVDLNSAVTCEAAAKYNSQIKFGGDVISRINYARLTGGGEALHRAIIEDIDTLIDDLVRRAKVGRGEIHCVVAAGNTAMVHFLLGLEADLIRLAPFVPAAAAPPPLRAAEVGIRIHPRGLLYTLPAVGSYVGGDITAGVLACGMHRREELALLIDIGTNGEVVLGNRDFLVACSASAGPAFEGGAVSCGMRAGAGAIDHVRIGRDTLAVFSRTIDGRSPVGVCGTGLIDALAEMSLAGLVDRGGRFRTERSPDCFCRGAEDGRPGFRLVNSRRSGGGRDIVVTQCDVENLIRTKGAIYAAVDSLVESLGLSLTDIRKVYIAGGFGNRLDLESCVAIGLLPDLPVDRFRFIGNGSITGAKLAMLSHRLLEEAHLLRSRITYQELMADPAYMERFTSACFLPHTDLSRFPSVVERFNGRACAPVEADPMATSTSEVTT